MPRALEIPIEVTRLDRAVDSVRRFSGQVRGVGTVSEAAAAQAVRAWERAAARLMAANPGLSLEAARRMAPSLPADALTTAATRAASPRGGSFSDRATRALYSTRMNLGGASPLIGQTARLLGIPMTGAAGLGFAGAAGAVGLFVAAIHTAVGRLNEFGEAMRLSGGSARDVAGIGRFGFHGAAGAGAAGGFRQRIATDPMAMMFAARMGVRALPEPFGAVNNASVLRQGVEGLRRMTDAEERLRAARVLGLESALKYIDASPGMQALLDRQADLEEKMGGGAKAANDLAIATETLSRSWEALLAKVGTGPIQGLTGVLQDIIEGNWARLLFQGAATYSGAFGDDPQAKHRSAIEENTKALKEHQEAMRAFFQPGAYGGGHYTGAAMPTGWSGDFLARQMESGALSKGIPGV